MGGSGRDEKATGIGGSYYTCFATGQSGVLYCWGNNENGEATVSLQTEIVIYPTKVDSPLLKDVVLPHSAMFNLSSSCIRQTMFTKIAQGKQKAIFNLLSVMKDLPPEIQQYLFEVSCKPQNGEMLKYLNSLNSVLSCYSLNLSECALTRIPAAIFRCKKTLYSLNLAKNKISELPTEITELPLEHLQLEDNPVLNNIVIETYNRGTKSFLEYLKGIARSKTVWNSVKMIVLGKEGSGEQATKKLFWHYIITKKKRQDSLGEKTDWPEI